MAKHFLARKNDVLPGKMKIFQAGGREVLLCNVEGDFSALYSKCSHYGAPLVEGVLNGHRLTCPWHHACFDARTGRHIEAPGCNALKQYTLEQKGEELWVIIPDGEQNNTGHVPNPMVKQRGSEHKPYLIIGGGVAGQHTAEGMRQAGYTGPITLISAEQELPYDRTQLSKGFLSDETKVDKLPLRPKSFYRENDIDLLLGEKVCRIDVETKEIVCENGEKLGYEKLCVATGSTARQLQVPGALLPGVFTLRNLTDARHIKEAAQRDKTAVVVGASFIGLESASALLEHGCKVTVVARESQPFGKTFGERVGKAIQAWHEQKGVQFRTEEDIEALEGVRKVTAVKLKSGDSIPASLVVVGIGVDPNIDLLTALNIELNGGIKVDRHQYAGRDIWVAGDIASAPQNLDGSGARIEHWRVAAQQGTIAGHNMAGVQHTLLSVPFFWTAQAGKNLRYAGHHKNPDEIVYEGNVEEGVFLAFYLEANKVTAVLACGRDTDLAAIHELMWLGAMPQADQLDPKTDWVEMLLEKSRS